MNPARGLAVAAALALGSLAACGGATPTTETVDLPLTERVLPAVEVRDLARGDTVDLASLLPAERPLLVWFWAPH